MLKTQVQSKSLDADDRCCTEYDWRLQPLFMTLKHLFKLNNIVGGGGGERLTRHALKNKINKICS
jgi:hypothetical protein